ncbi:MAG: S8 family serine peptidase [Bryobacteraceae bacterium]
MRLRLALLILPTCIFLSGVILAPSASATPPTSRGWVVLLNDPPVVARYPGRIETMRASAQPYRQHILEQQQSLRGQIEAMNIHVTGAVQHVLNGIFVRATPDEATALRGLPGVKAVLPLRRYYKKDQLSLSNVQGAWAASGIGGQTNAGAGLKIAIIDTGIDETHPSFQDPSLKPPAGFPKCDVPSNCAFTNNKVIVARSYVSYLSDGSDPNDPAADSRPDDQSAHDLDGHGSATSSVAAGVSSVFNGIKLSGVAPKAFLGNYKVFGSPEVNNSASDAGIIQALDDAVTDGMDVVSLSLGAPAFSGPLDTGSACGIPPGEPCDPTALAIEEAVRNGQVSVVVAAGNEGDTGYQNVQSGAATFGTIGSPADAPSAIAAGGLVNDVTYAQSVEISGNNVPADLQRISGFESADGPIPSDPLTGPLVDVTKVGNSDGLLCNGLTGPALSGDIALILRGTCNFSVKVANAENAGAIGVLFINNGPGIINIGGLANTDIPAFLIYQTDGQNLMSYIDSNPGAKATLDPDPSQVSASDLGFIPSSVVEFSSRGPATGTNGLKPDVSAAATSFLLAAENYDPYGDLFSLSRYAVADGTSFSTPLIAGAAALVKQGNPRLTPLQIKSALVNTATLSGIQNQDGTGPASLSEVGSGLLQAQNAVLSTVQVAPSSVSFGLLSGSLAGTQTLTVSNTGSAAVNLTISVAQPTGLSGTQVLVNNATSAGLTIPAGSAGSVAVSLAGAVPAAGRYEGLITIAGAPVPMHIPYMFLVGNNTPYDVIPLYGQFFDGPINQPLPPGEGPLALRVIDQFGAPVANAAVQWAVAAGGGSIIQGADNTSTATDQNGIAFASVSLGGRAGNQEFTGTVNGMVTDFDGYGRLQPTINPKGIVDGASFTSGQAVSPGSIISIFGTGLADFSDYAFSLPLPLGIDGVAFSFDVPSANISVPARFFYISPDQLNVQVPWELAGQSSVTVKVIINYTYSAEYTLPLATYSPGFFVNNVGGQPIAATLDAANNPVGAGNPVARGTAVALFLNGLGPVNHQPASGSPGPSNQSATTTSTPVISIGGQPATVIYSGLAPGFAGVYQVNATVPQGIGTGAQSVTCSIGGVTAKPAYLIVK